MTPGPKLTNPARKKLAGTFNTTLDRDTKQIVALVDDAPSMPGWLPESAKAVWREDLARVVACGATSVDSGMFALYCTTMADFIASVERGEPVNAAFRSELRKQMELLGIAGAKSRLAKIVSTAPQATRPFTVRK